MKRKKHQRATSLPHKLNILAHIAARDNSDVSGSYTGTPKEGGTPTQDADDL